MPLQIRVFRRVSEPGNLDAAMAAVDAESNAFLNSIGTVDVANIETTIVPVDKYGSKVLYAITVAYVEE